MSGAKRLIDLSVSVAGVAVSSPLLLLIAIAVKAGDGGPVFFRQERAGRGGQPFRMWKFRTMVPDAERHGPQLTVAGDGRITRVGAWLRHSKLDELPQLFNVIAGDMSLVGPRPEVPRYVHLYTPQQRRVLELTPGITDPGSLTYVDEGETLAAAADPERLYLEQIMPEKIRVTLEYAARASASRDLGVLLKTVARVIRRLVPHQRGRA